MGIPTRRQPSEPRTYGHGKGNGHQCIRIYPNGEFVETWWYAYEVGEWIAYNALFRFGNCLFVDGELVNMSPYHPREWWENRAAELKAEGVMR
jgi:hypothetical protein